MPQSSPTSKVLERLAMALVRAWLRDRLARQLSQTDRQWWRPTSGHPPEEEWR